MSYSRKHPVELSELKSNHISVRIWLLNDLHATPTNFSSENHHKVCSEPIFRPHIFVRFCSQMVLIPLQHPFYPNAIPKFARNDFQTTFELPDGPKEAPRKVRKASKVPPRAPLEPPADPGRFPDRPKCNPTTYMHSNSRSKWTCEDPFLPPAPGPVNLL